MSPSIRRRFVLVDPCLVSAGSHPLHYAAEVLAAAERVGCECSLFGNRACGPGLRVGGWPVQPTFTHTAYSKYTVAGGLEQLDPTGRGRWRPRLPWGAWHAARRREERIALFAREVTPLVAGLRSGDVVLLATASELEIAGLARAAAAARPAADIGWHALLHFPVYRGFAADQIRQDRRIAWARELLAAAVTTLPGLRLHATTEELAVQYMRLGGVPVGVLPYPIQRFDRDDSDRLVNAGGGLRVSCLGDARPEKGSAAIPEIVAAAAADPTLADVRFTVQTNLGFAADSRAAEHRAVRRGLEALGRLAAARGPVDLLPGPLDAEAYARALMATDIMLLPYDQERYRPRCSGIVLEALAAGVVPLVTGGGWMARQLAGPLRRHADTVLARAAVRVERRIERPAVAAGRPLIIDVPAAGAGMVADRQEVIAVEIQWRGGIGFADPPVRVAVDAAQRLPATLLAADESGQPSAALFPLAAGQSGPCRVTCMQQAVGPDCVQAVVIRRLAAAGPVPAGAVGAVVAAPEDVIPALRELVRHRDHYRETARQQAVIVRAAASGDAVLRRLLP